MGLLFLKEPLSRYFVENPIVLCVSSDSQEFVEAEFTTPAGLSDFKSVYLPTGSAGDYRVNVSLSDLIKPFMGKYDFVLDTPDSTSSSTVFNCLGVTVQIRQGESDLSCSFDVYNGGISKEFSRYLEKEGTDIFSAKVLNINRQFLLTTRTNGRKVVLRESEICQLYYIRASYKGIYILTESGRMHFVDGGPAGAVRGLNLEYFYRLEKESNPDMKLPVLMRVLMGVDDSEEALEVFQIEIVASHLTPGPSPKERGGIQGGIRGEIRVIEFENSYGVMERVEVSGRAVAKPKFATDGTYDRYDLTVFDYVKSTDRVSMEEVIAVEFGYKTAEEFWFARDMIQSRKKYLMSADGSRREVLVSSESFSHYLDPYKPASIPLEIRYADSDTQYSPVADTSCRIIFDGNGGSLEDGMHLAAVAVPRGTLWEDVEKPGFFLAGIQAALGFTTTVDDNDTLILPDYVVKEDIRVYATYDLLTVHADYIYISGASIPDLLNEELPYSALSTSAASYENISAITYSGKSVTFKKSYILSVIVGKSSSTILPDYLLYSCPNLSGIDISRLKGITDIGSRFMSDCNILTLDLSHMSSLHTIGTFFLSQSKTETVILPSNTISSVGHHFLSNTRIKYFDASKLRLLTVIPDYFLDGCTELSGVDFPVLCNTVTIGNYFMSNCSKLTGIQDLSKMESLTAIGDFFLGSTPVLETVILPQDTISAIGGAFLASSGIEYFDTSSLRLLTLIPASFMSSGSRLESIDFTPMTLVTQIDGNFLSGNKLTSITLFSVGQITSVGYSFLGRTTILPHADLSCLRDIQYIPENFLEYSGVQSVTFPNFTQLLDIGSYFMQECKSLQSIDIARLVLTQPVIGQMFLRNCTSLTSFDMSVLGYLSVIPNYFLNGCTGITSIDLSQMANLERIGSLFMYGSGLGSIDLSPVSGTLQQISTDFLANCHGITSLDLSSLVNLLSVSTGMLNGSINATNINIGSIPASAFSADSSNYAFYSFGSKTGGPIVSPGLTVTGVNKAAFMARFPNGSGGGGYTRQLL